MVIDLVILLPLIGFGVLGFRDGSARKLVAIVVIILGMFLGHVSMHGLGTFLSENLKYQPATAPITAFLMIFLILFLLQLTLYRLVTGNYKFAREGAGSVVDRICGAPLGVVEGVIFISVFIMLITMRDGPPRSRTTRDSRLYAPVASVAPQIMDLFSNALPAAKEALENIASPGTGAADSTLQNQRR